MFKNTEQFNDIIQELKAEKILSEVARFECFDDSIATFSYTDADIYYEFNFVCDDTFFREMKISELLKLKRITYFNFGIYDKPIEEYRKMGGIKYSSYNTSGLN